MPTDETLITLTTEAIEKLDLAIGEILKIPRSERDEKYKIGQLGYATALLREFQYQIVPALRPPLEEPDPSLTNEQSARVAQLTEAEINTVDEMLLANTSRDWRKVARVVATTLPELQNHLEGIPDVFYTQRIRRLVENGALESQGDLSRMRYSEVRLPSDDSL